MNEIVNKFLLSGDKFIPEMHLRQPRFAYSACGAFTKTRKKSKSQKNPEDSQYIYQDELDKACFQHNMADGDFKDLTRRKASDKILRVKAFKIAKKICATTAGIKKYKSIIKKKKLYRIN